MKIQEKKEITASLETVWKVLVDFKEYPKWNPFVKHISGEKEIGAHLDVQFSNKSVVKRNCLLSGFISPKYVSFSVTSAIGGWWYHGEHVFRLVQTENGRTDFINESYCFGLSVKFTKNKLAGWLRRGMIDMNMALKEQC